MNEVDPVPETLSKVYHALRAPRRCYVIRIMSTADGEGLSTRPLARKVTAIEQGVKEKNATGEPYRNVYNALSQTHLPTLEDAGVIIYDSNRQTVNPGPNFRMAVLLLILNRVTFQTLHDDEVPEPDDLHM